jgi:peroxiredoxin Q/BCP
MKAGDTVPDFELPDQDGIPRRLSTLLADGPVVLFFYPAAMTTGCTKESCHFRDMKAEYEQAGVQRVGISTDSVETQKLFSDTHKFDYPLLADTDATVAGIFGVKRGAIGRKMGAPVKRQTFVIGQDSKVVEVIASELKFELHADEALRALAKA